MADRTVVYRLQAITSGFSASMAQAGASTKKLAGDLTSMEKSSVRTRQGLDTLGGAAGKVGLVAAAGLGAAVMASANFDQAMSNIQAATHDTAENMELLREAALQAGADTAFSATEAAAGVEELAKAGVSTADILAGGLAGALDLAAAGGLEVAEAAEISATALTQFKLEGQDVAHVADLLAAGAGKAQGSVTDMGMALKQSGLVAAQTGLSVEETTGTLAAFAAAGLIGSDAGTSFKTMLQSLTPTSTKAKSLMTELGISAYDASGNFVGMTEFAGSLQEGLAGLSVEQQNAAMKTIFGSDAVRAASVVFENGADGVQSWIDKVDDAGYAAETAATRMDNLKGDWEAFTGSLETALIGTGDGAQGPLRSLVQGATDAVNAFNKLPPAAQSATSGVLAGAALIGGSIWVGTKLINGVASAREAFASVGITADKTGPKLRGLGAAAAGAGVGLTIAFTAGNKIVDLFREDLPGVEQLTGMLLDLSGGDVGALPDEFNSLADSIERINNPSFWKGQQTSDTVLGFFGQEGRTLATATDEIDALDAALANLTASAGSDVAADALTKLGEAQGLSADEMERLKTLLPSYNEAVAGAGNAAKVAAVEQDGLSAATNKAARAAQRAEEAQARQTAALKAAREAARETAASFIGISGAVDGAKQSLGSFLKNLEDQAAALRDFRLNAEKAAKRGLKEGLIAELRDLGPEGARAMRQLADATDSEIKRANQAWMAGQQEAKKYENAVAAADRQDVNTNVNVNAGPALNALSQVDRWLNMLDGKRATTYIDTIRMGARTVPGLQMAGGGQVVGPGTSTSDSVPIWGSDGEFMMKAAAVDKYGVDFFHRLNAMQLANGGMVGAQRVSASPSVSVGSPNVSVGGSSVRVFIDGNEVRAIVKSEISDANAYARATGPRSTKKRGD